MSLEASLYPLSPKERRETLDLQIGENTKDIVALKKKVTEIKDLAVKVFTKIEKKLKTPSIKKVKELAGEYKKFNKQIKKLNPKSTFCRKAKKLLKKIKEIIKKIFAKIGKGIKNGFNFLKSSCCFLETYKKGELI